VRILLVEDDSILGDGIVAGLKLGDYAVDWVRDGESARLALLDHPYDACVLDLGLPRRDGLSVLSDLRGRGSRLPVLILTARDTSADKVAGLDAGADDYLTKPFDLPELLARLRAIIRRATGDAKPTLEHAGVVLDPSSKQVTFNGQPLRCRRANTRCCSTSCATATASARARSSKRASTPGARKPAATPSRSSSITCARSSAPTSSAPFAAWATSSVQRGQGDGPDLFRQQAASPSLRWRLLTLVSIAAVVILAWRRAQLPAGQARSPGTDGRPDVEDGGADARPGAARAGASGRSCRPTLPLRGLNNRRKRSDARIPDRPARRHVLARSSDAPAVAISGALGFATIEHEGQPWRSLILETADGTIRIQVAQSITKRNKEALEIATKTVQPLGVIFPCCCWPSTSRCAAA
jgi:CheY-like chemotaxis protein